MIDLYYWPTPNGHKVTMFLEEADLQYRIHPIDISAGDRFEPDFLAISPQQPNAGDALPRAEFPTKLGAAKTLENDAFSRA